MRLKHIVQLSFIATLCVFAFCIYYQYYLLNQPMLGKKVNQPLIFQVKKNTTASELLNQLKERKLIDSRKFLLIFIQLKGLAHQLKAGIYQIKPQDSALDFIVAVSNGDVLVQQFTIVEGTTLKQVLNNLSETPYLTYNPTAFSRLAPEFKYKEGLFLADTYQYEAGGYASDLLKKANQDLNYFLQKAWKNKQFGLPYKTPYQMLIAASIIEKETGFQKEKPLIASVIVNRLNKKMRLQVDPTVIYALGERYHGKLTKNNLKVDSPYNTYKNAGLPPTPIAMVSRSSIEAAAHPGVSDYIYFVAKGDGTHQFSRTYQEQIEAIQKFLK